MKVRLARTETLIRPDYIQYTPITSIDGFNSLIRAANPLLKPAQSTNFDAAVSVYENKIGLLTFAAFHKSIEDLIIPVNFSVNPLLLTLKNTAFLPEELKGLYGVGPDGKENVPASWYSSASPPLNTYINNPFKAKYKGIEIDWQTNFWYLPSVLKGLVVNVNYTYIDSEMRYQGYYLINTDSIRTTRPRTYWQTIRTDSTRVGRMPDQPSHIANITLGYDLKGFSARFSFLYQTDVSTSVDPNNFRLDVFSGDYARFDITLKQKLPGNLEFFANFNNLNNRADQNYRAASTFRPDYIEYYGVTMDFGARYKF
jgi:TonB-dependent receptor